MECRLTVTVQSQIYGAGFISDLPLPCWQVKKNSKNSFVQVIRIRAVHSITAFQHSPDINCHPILQ